ncbi:MAG: site-specific DNA-methyltransferase [Dehalococcoidia bacterium]
MPTLNFKGKTFVQNHHLAVKYHELVPKNDKSLTGKVSLNDNLILHGDNLKALKALLPNYAGKVKCIYIDPPYNTGNERWVYNDNVNSPMMQEWLGKIVDREDFTRHDKWLCMMMPRLKLLRELLREDGVIFVSIDDNEAHHLRMLMDEVFGDDNFVQNFMWLHGKGKKDTWSRTLQQYILCYAKNKNMLPQWSILGYAQYEFSNPDNDPRGSWFSGSISFSEKRSRKEHPNYFVIKSPSGTVWKRQWHCTKEEMEEYLKENKIFFGLPPKYNNVPRLKIFPGDTEELIPPNIIDDVETTREAQRNLDFIFGEKLFDFPKPVGLIKRLLQISTNQNSIILDSFAGSGTTAHAVLALNKEDGGKRKSILVECEDYADKITAERIRRVIKGIPKAKDEQLREGLGGTFSYFELGDPIEMESILEGDKLPSFLELARYVFYTATGEEFDSSQVDEKRNFIGESKEYEAYLFYKPDIEYLKSTALTLERAKNLGPYNGKKRLVFAPSKYLDTDYLLKYRIDYCQLPFEIYKLKE